VSFGGFSGRLISGGGCGGGPVGPNPDPGPGGKPGGGLLRSGSGSGMLAGGADCTGGMPLYSPSNNIVQLTIIYYTRAVPSNC